MMDRIISALFGFIVSAVVILAVYGIPTPKPYTDVDLLSYEVVGGKADIQVVFTKNKCVYIDLVVVGDYLGEPEYLLWETVGNQPEGDRIKGKQKLHLSVDLNGQEFDYIDIRTRHQCANKFVDKTLIRIDLR